MSYYVSYDDKTKNQSIYYHSTFEKGIKSEYYGAVGELLIDFLYLDFYVYNIAFQIIKERYYKGLYFSKYDCFHHDRQKLEVVLGIYDVLYPSIDLFGEDYFKQNFIADLYDSFMKEHGISNIEDFSLQKVSEIEKINTEKIIEKVSEDIKKIRSNLFIDKDTEITKKNEKNNMFKSPMEHLYFRTLYSDAYIENRDDYPGPYLIQSDYGHLQMFYLKAIEFCFNLNQRQDLKDLSKLERLYVFGEIYDKHGILYSSYGESMGKSISHYLILNDLEKRDFCLQEHLNLNIDETGMTTCINLNEEIDIDNTTIEIVKSSLTQMHKYTLISDPFSACYLEFMRLLELDINIKKCKNCGKLFVVTDGYNVEYCNRVQEGETKSCKEIGAVRNYAKKVKNDPILEAYNKAYKTHFARIRYKKMTQEEFNNWAISAKEMKDKVNKGEITLDEYRLWLKN